jgi:steroid 5-alpha reductase family enzyme
MPLFALCALLSFAVNWAVFVPAHVFQTEHYFDLTGSLTYLVLVSCAVGFAGAPDARGILLALLIGVWAVRLGSFLFIRVKKDGSDGRFDEIKPNFLRFLMAWTLQGLWVFLTASCAVAAITSSERVTLGWVGVAGAVVWLVGFGIEVVADTQKRRFRADPTQRGQFITEGLWAWSRHPNYFGEILLWVGIAIVALPALSGWQLITLISPLFVYVLLTRISGVPLLESRAKRKWGDDPKYRAYKARTPVLIPRPPAARGEG